MMISGRYDMMISGRYEMMISGQTNVPWDEQDFWNFFIKISRPNMILMSSQYFPDTLLISGMYWDDI